MGSLSNLRYFSALNVGVLPRTRTRTGRVSVLRSSMPDEIGANDEALKLFFKERQQNGDFVSKSLDLLWRRDGMRNVELDATSGESSEQSESIGGENDGGFLKLSKTYEWVSGEETAPINKKLVLKQMENDRDRRRRLNILKYDALKAEMMFLTIGIGTICTGYCAVALSFQVAISYAAGVLFSCLYLLLLYNHADNLSKEAVPQVFLKKKPKNPGIRSEDLEDLLERTVRGSAIALSSPRLMIPVAIYGFWGLCHNFLHGFLDIELVPTMVGMFAYKAAALVQVYRDNEDLRLVFPESAEDSLSN
ncbi:hypothetical protein Syun_002753 [Stephania yunnanensis]|uniref:CGL160/ATPI domain-containing protein n=1 Tax=Stephania yunnanensis TaxID=152371 RepID=A0AAP0LH36_9MAGN